MAEEQIAASRDDVFTLREAADFLKVSYSTVQLMTKTGELPSWRPARNKRIVRVRRADLEKVIGGDFARAS